MRTYLLRRLGQFVPVLILATIAIWGMIYALPGTPAELLAGDNASAEQIAAVEARLGLDQPVWQQYLTWLGHAIRGDLGTSYASGFPVTSLIAERILPTVQLTVFAMIFLLLFAIPLGTIAALKPHTWYGRIVQAGLGVGLAVPTFWLGILLILAFSISLGWLPSASVFTPFWQDPVAAFANTVLPALAIGIHASSVTARFVRSSVLDVMDQDFIRTARAKGAPETVVIARHALRNALLPTVTITGLQLGNLLGGAIVVEVVFTYPGLGRLLYSAIETRDYGLIQGAVLLVVIIFVALNLLVDLLYAALDPRIRLA